jgi:hypothetical protein
MGNGGDKIKNRIGKSSDHRRPKRWSNFNNFLDYATRFEKKGKDEKVRWMTEDMSFSQARISSMNKVGESTTSLGRMAAYNR